MDKKLRLRRGLEQKHIKMNPRLRLTREEEMKGMKTQEVVTQTVEILGTQEGGFTVNKYTVVKQCDLVSFSNGTEGEVIIQFQMPTLFQRDTLELGPAGTPNAQQELSVSETAPIGTFCFSAFCLAGRKFAVANSTPIIIINPKDDR